MLLQLPPGITLLETTQIVVALQPHRLLASALLTPLASTVVLAVSAKLPLRTLLLEGKFLRSYFYLYYKKSLYKQLDY